MNQPAAARPSIDLAHWSARLAELATLHHVPGAQLGILRLGADGQPDEVQVVAHGVLSLRTGQPATSDSVFQIGSITKVWTATQILQLVDDGKLDLDGPVVDVLPELRLADADVTRAVTTRHLLNHTSGIDGDVFTDTGRGDDCLQTFVGLLVEQTQNHPLGATWSYCNAGYVVLGRIVEVLTGLTWDRALKERIAAPLGLTHTSTLPEEALLFGAAVGHLDAEGDAPQRVAPVWGLPRSIGPAGLITSSAADVLAFARMHLVGGLAPDGTRVLSQASADAMTAWQADVPDKHILGDSWGLGWIRFDWGGERLIGHDGNTIGQAAFLRVLPSQGLAVTLLTNGGQGRDLYEELYTELFAALAGVRVPARLAPPEPRIEVDITPYVGTYERASVRMEVIAADTEHPEPRLRMTVSGTLAELVPEPPKEYPLVPVGPALFAIKPPESAYWIPVTFYALPTGERYLHFGARATRWVG